MSEFNYDRPIGGPANAHGFAVNRGWGWNWTGREKATGRVRTYFTRTSFGSKADLKAHVEQQMPGIEFLDGGEATGEPAVVMPLPPHSFQAGILEAVKREMQGDVRTRSPHRTLPRVPIVRQPLIRGVK